MRHTHEYKLIVHEDAKINKISRAPEGLLRLDPSKRVPAGYFVVNAIAGSSVYNYDGMLRPQYKALSSYK